MAQLFFDDFETGDFSNWTTDSSGANLVVNMAAALVGTYGVEATPCFGCGHAVFKSISPRGSVYRVGFKADKNDLSLTLNDFIELTELRTTVNSPFVSIDIINDGGSLKYRANTFDDLGGNNYAYATAGSGTQNVEARFVGASTDVSSDGAVYIYINGVLIDSATGIDNYNQFNDGLLSSARLGVELFNGNPSSGSIYIDNYTIRNDDTPIFPPSTSTDEYDIAPMKKPADIDSDGTNIYVSALDNNGLPVLIQIASTLDTNGSLVFEPGAGDDIGVECGRFDADVIWVAGNFDGTNVIEKSEDGGSTFEVKDDGTIGDVRTFVMGPDSDDRLLVFDETNGDILETINSGESWTNINNSVTPEVNAIGRLGQNVEESVFGNDGGGSNSINYSVNSGDDLEDYQTGVYPNANSTRVIVN